MDEVIGRMALGDLTYVWRSACAAMDLDLVEYDPELQLLRWRSAWGVLHKTLSPERGQLSLTQLLEALEPQFRPKTARDLAMGNGFEVAFKCKGEPIWVEWRPLRSRGIYLCRETSERHRLLRQLAQSVEQERQRFAEQLHDDLCQQLVGARLLAGQLARDADASRSVHCADAKQLADVLTHATESARLLSKGLAGTAFSGDLRAQVKELADNTAKLFSIDCTVACSPAWPQLPKDTERMLFKIIREAVCNAAKHSGGTLIEIHLEQKEEVLRARIRDNGVGMPVGAIGGMGMELMKSRAQTIGARLTVLGQESGGTEALCELPLRA